MFGTVIEAEPVDTVRKPEVDAPLPVGEKILPPIPVQARQPDFGVGDKPGDGDAPDAVGHVRRRGAVTAVDEAQAAAGNAVERTRGGPRVVPHTEVVPVPVRPRVRDDRAAGNRDRTAISAHGSVRIHPHRSADPRAGLSTDGGHFAAGDFNGIERAIRPGANTRTSETRRGGDDPAGNQNRTAGAALVRTADSRTLASACRHNLPARDHDRAAFPFIGRTDTGRKLAADGDDIPAANHNRAAGRRTFGAVSDPRTEVSASCPYNTAVNANQPRRFQGIGTDRRRAFSAENLQDGGIRHVGDDERCTRLHTETGS